MKVTIELPTPVPSEKVDSVTKAILNYNSNCKSISINDKKDTVEIDFSIAIKTTEIIGIITNSQVVKDIITNPEVIEIKRSIRHNREFEISPHTGNTIGEGETLTSTTNLKIGTLEWHLKVRIEHETQIY